MGKHRVAKKIEKHTDYKPKTEPSLDWLSCKLNNTFYVKSFLTEFFDLNSSLYDVQTIELKDKSLMVKYTNGLVWFEFPESQELKVKLTITSGGFAIYFLENDLDSFLRWIYKNAPFHEDQYGINYLAGITRIDIAYDDTIGLIPMSRIYKWIRNRQVKTRLRDARPQFKIDLKTGLRGEGFTWYMGQRANSLFIRFYDKASMQRELKIKLDEEIHTCNRMEFELKDKLANQLFTDYLHKEDFDFREFFQDKVSFKSRKMSIGEKHKERIPDHPAWSEFMRNCEPKKLVLPKDRYNYDTLRNYLEQKMSSGLGTYLTIEGNLQRIVDLYKKKKESGELNLKHMNLLKTNPNNWKFDKIIQIDTRRLRNAG